LIRAADMVGASKVKAFGTVPAIAPIVSTAVPTSDANTP
jgi:hypothetical protein